MTFQTVFDNAETISINRLKKEAQALADRLGSLKLNYLMDLLGQHTVL